MPGPSCTLKELGAVACCLALSTAAAWSQETTYIERSVRTQPSITSDVTTIVRSPIENLDKRLVDIHSWINKGMNHGWLTLSQGSDFDRQVKQLRDEK